MTSEQPHQPKRPKVQPLRSGDRCPQCGKGKMKTVRTITRGSLRIRYLRCDACNRTDKEILQLDGMGRPALPAGRPF